MDFDYTVETNKSVDDAVAAVEAESAERGFRVLHIHDVQATLAGKGFERDSLKIVEICNGKFASQVLERDVKIALMLPCPVCVYVDGGKTWISTMKPSAMTGFYPEADIGAIAMEVERIVLAIVDASK